MNLFNLQHSFNAGAFRAGVFSCLLIFISMLSNHALAASQTELTGVKTEISRQQQQLDKAQKQLNNLQGELKKHELSINAIEQAIKQTEAHLKKANTNVNQYQQQKSALEKQQKTQSDTLKELVKTYYITRRKYDAATLLQNDNKAELDRISHYFQHLAKERSKAIEALMATETELETTHRALKQKQQEISDLLATQQSKKKALTDSQTNRKKTISQIKNTVKNDKTYLSELQRNENRLKAEIAKAVKRAAIPMNGLTQQKGRLPWPLRGTVLHHYGTKQTGQVNWKGMVISAKHQQPVKAVYSGTVVFAEYLRGYGLLVLVDHGKGDMTLYGFNQTLMKKEGDKVQAGEIIALAGDTGGQDRTSLYFEIRRNSKAQNPTSWLTR
ncbi:peptidoglycan DD-metalloendopeptidase family protein [Vibrio sp. S9_S30]|uniref:murein hydrolase activator EnvC family protein n=1 Tax=Vibrio sp. S9_S30 TaxID=2720226 RepID=UPI001680C2B2|nr:peptidoglycan DD-metalloendopeptidase family protein [Vibrio sp. S9_S30]MBD1558458.1 peptidoglycan DD-metalloendopeptidase family protein [Vibrio sp. S9_S30]